MGFRFRKGIRIASGLRLNITKRGISSLSVGGKGLTYNIGKKGTRATGGLPGTGLSYSEYSAYEGKEQSERIDPETGEIFPAEKRSGPPWGLILVIAIIIGSIYIIRTNA